MSEYKFRNLYNYVPTGIMVNDLYNIIKIETALYITDIYHKKMEALSDKYADYDFERYEREVGIYARVSSCLNDNNIGNLSDYANYFIRNFNTSLFSKSYVIETQATMRVLKRIDTYINRLKLDVMVKIPTFSVNTSNDPYMSLIYYFAEAKNKSFYSFENFLDQCESAINDVLL